jgi:hypothetical protein
MLPIALKRPAYRFQLRHRAALLRPKGMTIPQEECETLIVAHHSRLDLRSDEIPKGRVGGVGGSRISQIQVSRVGCQGAIIASAVAAGNKDADSLSPTGAFLDGDSKRPSGRLDGFGPS